MPKHAVPGAELDLGPHPMIKVIAAVTIIKMRINLVCMQSSRRNDNLVYDVSEMFVKNYLDNGLKIIYWLDH